MTWDPREKWGSQGYKKGEESVNEQKHIKMGAQVESREGTEPETSISVYLGSHDYRQWNFTGPRLFQFANWDMFSPYHPSANLKTCKQIKVMGHPNFPVFDSKTNTHTYLLN